MDPRSNAPPPSAADARKRLERGRAEILARHRAGATGHDVVRAIAALTDEVLRDLLAAVTAEVPGGGDPLLSVVATGGYGRGELSPRSDVDLLALLPDPSAPSTQRTRADQIAERLHRALWDANLEAGFAARTIDQCLSLAREDHTARTALLECRLVAGDLPLFNRLERAVLTELEARKIEEFIEDKLEEYQERRKRYGSSVWLLEPHLKQGKGGLRDLQTALWIARARHQVLGLGEAGARGLLPKSEIEAARAARETLWRLRNELHYATNRRDDRLTFDNQRKVADGLGYRDAPKGELAVEQLMHGAYLALQELARASDALIDRCAIEDAPRAALRRAPPPRVLDAAFKLWNGRIMVNDAGVFQRRPADMLRLYAVAETYGVPVHSGTRDLVIHELPQAKLATDRDAHFELWQLLVREGSEGTPLVPLHELGVLGALLPEIARLRARAQHSLYHVYTVDTHTVFALVRMMRLRAGALADAEPGLTRLARAQERPLVLMLGLLFHDLGKGLANGLANGLEHRLANGLAAGLGDDHSARGAALVRDYAQRIGLDPADAADIAWLVEAHLEMSHISQRRDLEDHALLEEFARNAQTIDRLEMLYLLTYADMASVSPENWTQWKAGLLRTLYERTRAVMLAEGLGAPEHAQSVEARRERLAARIGDPLAAEFVHALPERYLASARPEEAARHLKLWSLARRTGFAAELHAPDAGEAELTLVAPDRAGLLALFTAALAANGIDILAAEVHSLGGGIALDRFVVRESGGGVPSKARWEAARLDLLKLLAGAEDGLRLVEKRLRRASFATAAAPAVETKIRVDDLSSEEMTIIDVVAQDRPGLLHALAEAFHAANVSIEVARIATEGNRATDAFYVRDTASPRLPVSSGKVQDPARSAAIVASLQAAIASLAGRG